MTNQFYHNLITEKSWQLLQELNRERAFILIGGWAVFLYSGTLKSKDIDLILDYSELARLKEKCDVSKNERLHKYEIKREGIDVDIYVPYFSQLGVAVEEIQKNINNRQGFNVPQLEILFLLKLFAYAERQGTLKGKKDELDILSLSFLDEFNWPDYRSRVRELKFEKQHNLFVSLLKTTVSVPELQINKQKMARTRRRIMSALE